MLLSSTISLELQAKMVKEIDRKVQFHELQKPRDLDLDLGLGQTGA